MSHPHPELGPPPPLPEGALRVVALGGLGEVGRAAHPGPDRGQAAGAPHSALQPGGQGGAAGSGSGPLVVPAGCGVLCGYVDGARGFAADDSVFDEVRDRVEDALERAVTQGIGDTRQLEQIVRRTVGKWVSDTYRRRPMIIPLVVEI